LKQLVNHRFHELKSGELPANDSEKSLVELLTNGVTADETVTYAYNIFSDNFKREVLEAFVLAKATEDDIWNTLKIPKEVTKVYHNLFFDTSVFKDELDVEAYAQTYPKTPTSWGHDLKCCALTLGLNYMKYRFSRGPITIDITTSLNEMIANASFLSRAARLNPLDSEATKEARHWMDAAIKAMVAYVSVKPATEAVKDEFELVLKAIDQTTTEQVAVNLDELVH
jgi:hypothetical protein